MPKIYDFCSCVSSIYLPFIDSLAVPTGQEREEAERAEYEKWVQDEYPEAYKCMTQCWKAWLAGRAALRASGKEGA